MKNISYKRSCEDKYVVKGVLSEDATTIHVVEKDFEKDIVLKDCLDEFTGEHVEITIKSKTEEDLLDSDEE